MDGHGLEERHSSIIRNTRIITKVAKEHTIRRILDHQCVLQFDTRSPVEQHIVGWGTRWRRPLRSSMLASRTLPCSRDIFLSTAGIEEEQARHLSTYICIIHPFSDSWCYWQYTMALIYLWNYMLISFEISSAWRDVFDAVIYMKILVDLFNWIDILLHFSVGFYSFSKTKKHRVDLRPRSIALRYISRFFIIDLLSSLPISLALKLVNPVSHDWWHLKLILLLKAVRLGTFLTYASNLMKRIGLLKQTRRIICGTILYLLFILYIAAAFSCISILDDNEKFTIWSSLRSLYASVLDILLVSSFLPLEPSASFFHMTCYWIGFFFQMLFLSLMLTYYYDRQRVRNQYNMLHQEIGEYMRYKELSPALCRRIVRYVNFKHQKHLYTEAEILPNVPAGLRQDMLLYQCESLVQKVELFRGLPPHHLIKIIARLKCDVLLSGETIVQAGMLANSMFFIHYGTVAVYTANGIEMCHLMDGDHFGEIALVSNQVRAATVVAVTDCQLYRLQRGDFVDALDDCPELGHRLRHSALERLESTMRTMYSVGGISSWDQYPTSSNIAVTDDPQSKASPDHSETTLQSPQTSGSQLTFFEANDNTDEAQ